MRNKSIPEQLKWSENYNKVKWLHIKGKSNQAQEGKHGHGEVKPGQTKQQKHRTSVWYMFKYILVVFSQNSHVKITDVKEQNANVQTPKGSIDLICQSNDPVSKLLLTDSTQS